MISADVFSGVWLFEGISERGRRELKRRSTERRFAKNEILFREGASPNGLYIILEGGVRVVRTSALGRQHVIHTEGPGGTLGEVPIFDGAGYPATAIAAEATRCLVLSPDGIRVAFSAEPEIAWVVTRQLARRVRTLVKRLDERVTQPTIQRLAALLYERYDAVTGIARLTMTQSEIAEELGTVREVVVRDLRKLKHQGVIRSRGRGAYVVENPTVLQHTANGGTGNQ
jgi:CRP/FNR family transcriptional regulator